MTNYSWAYYQKSALAGGSGWGGVERKRGAAGIPTKPAEHPQTKEGDKFLLLLMSKKKEKNLLSITNWRCLEARKGARKVTRS